MIRVYTSATKSYIPKARVLAQSVKKLHPEYHFTLVLSDSKPESFDLFNEPFDELLLIDDLGIEHLDSWSFEHNIVELCTAVKGTALRLLLEKPNTSGVFYLDPDILVLNPLDELEQLFDEHDILLTPHMLHPETDKMLIHGNEIVSTLAHGVFNLGFIGVKNSSEGMRFAKWWEQRLQYFCFDDVPLGIFTDQRWCDLVPAFFPTSHIVRDSGCNVATWNILHRPITKQSGRFFAGGVPLKFYHFTGFDAGTNRNELLNRFARGYPAAFELWDFYGKQLDKYGYDDPLLKHWKYADFDNGVKISNRARKIYRENTDLQHQFPAPFRTQLKESFYEYLSAHGLLNDVDDEQEELRRLRRELSSVYQSRSWKITRPFRWLMSHLFGRV